MTRIFAVNGSPSMEKGTTAMVLEPFLQGAREAGAEIDLEYTKRLRMTPCAGEMECWYTHPGECRYKDAMSELYPRLRRADILVLATPVYIPLPAKFQIFINRLCPLIEPILEDRGVRTRARFHEDVAIGKIVLVSSGGWWERENMDTVLRIATEFAEDASVDFAGAVLRPHAFILRENEEGARRVFEALGRAGRDLVLKGRMCEADLETISQPLVDREELRQRYNRAYHRAAGR